MDLLFRRNIQNSILDFILSQVNVGEIVCLANASLNSAAAFRDSLTLPESVLPQLTVHTFHLDLFSLCFVLIQVLLLHVLMNSLNKILVSLAPPASLLQSVYG